MVFQYNTSMSEIRIFKGEKRKLEVVAEWLGAGSLNVFGRQFAGKDTYAKVLDPVLDAPVIGGGDTIRAAQAAGTLTPEIQVMLDAGKLIPSDDYRRMMMPVLGSDEYSGRPLLLSAVGRMFGEEDGVVRATQDAGHPIKAVPDVIISEATAFDRLKNTPARGRKDDTPEGLRKRLDEFTEHTVPVLDFYKQQGLYLPVDGEQPKQKVFNELVDGLHEVAQAA